ncbi:hypothetical protein [Thalassiella azotivora]
MIIDCDGCRVRDLACGDCVVSVLLGAPGDLDAAEARAIDVLAGSGLVPPLRLLAPSAPRGAAGHGREQDDRAVTQRTYDGTRGGAARRGDVRAG